MLVGLFWQVEHATLYKPPVKLKDIAREPSMKDRYGEVMQALWAFEDEIERLLQRDPLAQA